jgi:hypothetical protein
MHTGVSSYGVVWQVFFERYTRVLMEASPAFPIHFLKIYRTAFPAEIGYFDENKNAVVGAELRQIIESNGFRINAETPVLPI